VIARNARAILEALGIVKPQAPEGEPTPAAPPRRRPRSEEDEGRELWERLARGEEPVAVRVERPRPAAPPRRPRALETSLESPAEPAPLSVLGPLADAREPGEMPELSLERAAVEASSEVGEEPEPLAALGRAELSEAAPLALSSRAFRLVRGDLRRAVLLSEILAAPVSQRAAR